MPKFVDWINSLLPSLSVVTGTDKTYVERSGTSYETSMQTIANFAALAGSPVPDPLTLTKGLLVDTTNPELLGVASDAQAMRLNVTVSRNYATSYSDINGLEIVFNTWQGQNAYGGGTNAKKTFLPLAVNVDHAGSGQHFCENMTMNSHCMGDAFISTETLYYSGGPIGGDEGIGFRAVSPCIQAQGLSRATIQSVTRATLSTTITNGITGSPTAQDVLVGSTTGCSAGDWLVFGQTIPSSAPNSEGVKVISVNAGASTIRVIALNNQAPGALVRPALVLGTDNLYHFGQDQVLVNLSGATYSTGAAYSAGADGVITGVGTTWTAGIVGGNALNVGAVCFDADTYQNNPYSPATPLKSWFAIQQINSPTSLSVMSTSIIGGNGYNGNLPVSPGSGTYTIRPATKILWASVDVLGFWGVVCESSTHTWTVGDTVECAICPYPDVSGFQYFIGGYTPGGTYRRMMLLNNNGATMFESCLEISAIEGTTGQAGSDPVPWDIGVSVGVANVGMRIGSAQKSSIVIQRDVSTPEAGTRITWGAADAAAAYIGQNIANQGMDMTLIDSGSGGMLRTVSSGAAGAVDNQLSQLSWQGYLQLCATGSHIPPYIRFYGTNGVGDSIDKTVDLAYDSTGNALNVRVNDLTGVGVWNYATFSANGFAVNSPGVATNNTTNVNSNTVVFNTSVWDGSVARSRPAKLVAVPGSGIANAPITMEFQIWDNVNNNASYLNIPFQVRTDGLVKFGTNNPGFAGDFSLTLDAITNLTAARTVKFPDRSGEVVINTKISSLLSTARTMLTADISYYVTTAGNDSTGTGAVGAPWATIQHASDYVSKSIDINGFTITINIADGTYEGVLIHTYTGGGRVVFKGNNTTPANVIITDSTISGNGWGAFFSGSGTGTQNALTEIWISGFKLAPAHGPALYCYGSGSGIFNLGEPTFTSSKLIIAGCGSTGIVIQGNIYDNLIGPNTIDGAALDAKTPHAFWEMLDPSPYNVLFDAATWDITGTTLTFSAAFLVALGVVEMQINGAFNSGTAIVHGPKFRVGECSSLNLTVALTAIPGDTAGLLEVGSLGIGNTFFTGVTPVTVGTLPVATAIQAGARSFVTDSDATLAAALGNIVANSGAGSNKVPVYSDGTNWRIG